MNKAQTILTVVLLAGAALLMSACGTSSAEVKLEKKEFSDTLQKFDVKFWEVSEGAVQSQKQVVPNAGENFVSVPEGSKLKVQVPAPQIDVTDPEVSSRDPFDLKIPVWQRKDGTISVPSFGKAEELQSSEDKLVAVKWMNQRAVDSRQKVEFTAEDGTVESYQFMITVVLCKQQVESGYEKLDSLEKLQKDSMKAAEEGLAVFFSEAKADEAKHKMISEKQNDEVTNWVIAWIKTNKGDFKPRQVKGNSNYSKLEYVRIQIKRRAAVNTEVD
mgnify:CR=1 FL=1